MSTNPLLESITIGVNSFKGGYGDADSALRINGTVSLSRLIIGRQSFEHYSVFEIENVPSLEVIEMGELNESSGFGSASLELKSDSERMK